MPSFVELTVQTLTDTSLRVRTGHGMSSTVRKLLGVVLALIALLGGAVVFVSVKARQVTAAEHAAHDQVASQLPAVSNALGEAADALAHTAMGPTRFPPVKSLISELTSQSDFSEVSQTLLGFEGEPFFAPYEQIGHFAWFVGDKMLASDLPSVPPQLMAFAGKVASNEYAGTLMVHDGKTWLVGGARGADLTPQQERVTFTLFKALTTTALEPIALSQNVGILVQPLGKQEGAVAAGGTIATSALQRFASSMSVNDAACCATKELFPGVVVTLWRDPAPFLASASAETSRSAIGIFSVAGALALVCLFFGFRGGRRDEDLELIAKTTEQLKQSQDQLQRLSQQLKATGLSGVQPALVVQERDEPLSNTQASVQSSRYEAIAPLGEGGMAKVSVAVVRGAEGFRRVFVLKRLRAELSANPDAVNQFIDEARLGASLVHSNIVPIFDFGRDAEGYFLAQEYIIGRDVDALIEVSKTRRGRAIEPALATLITQEALKALGYAHSKRNDQGRAMGLVHRDISPNNLMISARGEVKLLDFGIVKSEERVTRTQAGMVKGNLFFMSPEQARALEVDSRSDLFSMGMVLFSMLNGGPMYSGDNVYDLMTRAAAGPNGPDLNRVDAVCGPLAPVVLKALSNDPADRFATAEEFAAALAEVSRPAITGELQVLMETLFADAFADERRRFAVTS